MQAEETRRNTGNPKRWSH